MSNIVIKNTKKYGRGLYAARNFKKGEVIEVSPVIVLTETNAKIADKTILALYAFEWDREQKSSALALGYGSLFNHSKEPNVSYSAGSNEMIFTTKKNVKKGEQFFIDYGYDPNLYKGYSK